MDAATVNGIMFVAIATVVIIIAVWLAVNIEV